MTEITPIIRIILRDIIILEDNKLDPTARQQMEQLIKKSDISQEELIKAYSKIFKNPELLNITDTIDDKRITEKFNQIVNETKEICWSLSEALPPKSNGKKKNEHPAHHPKNIPGISQLKSTHPANLKRHFVTGQEEKKGGEVKALINS